MSEPIPGGYRRCKACTRLITVQSLTKAWPLIDGVAEVPAFDRTALVTALRADQAGQTSFREFAAAAWRAGVLRYVVDLENRTCTYFGLHDQTYMEHYAAVEPSGGAPTS